MLKGLFRSALLLFSLGAFPGGPLPAQDRTLPFDSSAAGVDRSIENWGLDVTWPSYDNIRRGIIFMSQQEVDTVRVAFLVNAPLQGGDLTDAQSAELSVMNDLANLAGAGKPWTMSPGTGAGVDPWFKNGDSVIPSRWVQAIDAAARHYDRRFLSVEGFNEPDFGWGQGTVQDLYEILGLLEADSTFSTTALAGGSTLNCDQASWWYDQIKSRATEGTTHALAGSFHNYVAFYQNVIASGDVPVNPEVHNLVEVIAGAEYGLETGIWWGTAELARGEFVKACQGRRLGYAEERENWTAAAVYRSPSGAVQAFLGGSERMGQTTAYRFFCEDRDVFYDGDGPRRDFTVRIDGDQEKVIHIAWGADAPPVIDGRYIVVSRNSRKAIEVAGASTGNGANIRQNTYTGGAHQQWDIVPFSPAIGDQSFYEITAVHSGKAMDVFNFSYDNGGNVVQWEKTQGPNQLWFFEYVGDGWFYVRNRWSGKYLDVSNASTANGASIWQWEGLNASNQQWRLIPVGAAVEFSAPAAPTGVTARANALSVQLNWDASPEPDVAGHTVLRATTSGGPYDIVARDLTETTFTDASANQARTYFYRVRAVDHSLNSSENSDQVSATPSGSAALVVHTAFEGNTDDGSVNENHATAIGSPAMVAGKYGRAMNLNGTNQYAMLPAGFLAPVTDFTIAAWVRWDGGGLWQRVFDFGNGTSRYMFLTPSSASGTLRFAITRNGSSGEQILETSGLAVGVWQHVAITRAGNICRLYRNGVLAASGNVTISPASINPALNYLGESQYEADPLFDGQLDEFYVYSFALSAAEIAQLSRNQPPPLSLPFRRGDCDGSGEVNLADAVRDLRFCFGHSSIDCAAACDADGDGSPCSGVTDGVRLLVYLFRGGEAPPEPFPECGTVEGEVNCTTPPANCQ